MRTERLEQLQIDREDVIVSIPRGDDELRLAYVEATMPDGKRASWHSLRVFFKNDAGEWRPGKQGITIRSRELKAIADALAKAAGRAS